jgi:predicted nucleotidyltransferase
MQFEGLPDSFRTDIEQAIAVLTTLGAREVFIFGSMADRDQFIIPRDIDIAVSGLPKDRFFKAYGQLLVKMVHEVDLVDLDDDAASGAPPDL